MERSTPERETEEVLPEYDYVQLDDDKDWNICINTNKIRVIRIIKGSWERFEACLELKNHWYLNKILYSSYVISLHAFMSAQLQVLNGLFGPRREKSVRWFGTTKEQTSLHIRVVWSAPLLIAHWKVSYLDLLQAKFQLSS